MERDPERDDPTQNLIEAAQAGDPEAWGKIDRRFRRILALLMRGRVHRAARGRFDTEDVVQSAMFCAYQEIASYEYRGNGSFLRWLTGILENRARARLRNQRAAKRDMRRDRNLEAYDVSARDSAMVPSPSQILVQAESQARLLAAISELPEEEERILALHFFDIRPVSSIAEELGLPETTARRRLSRGLERLVRALEDEGESSR